jgi:hypothetical protein
MAQVRKHPTVDATGSKYNFYQYGIKQLQDKSIYKQTLTEQPLSMGLMLSVLAGTAAISGETKNTRF